MTAVSLSVQPKIFSDRETAISCLDVVDDLDPAEDGEASEETHRPSYQTQLSLSCHLNMMQL